MFPTFVFQYPDFITKIVFFILKFIFINKKSLSDTNSTFSVTLIKTLIITLPSLSEKDYT